MSHKTDNKKEVYAKYIIGKFLKTKDSEKNLKSSQEKRNQQPGKKIKDNKDNIFIKHPQDYS